jgi:ATP-dependent Clp protease ATP-binding subunit ClpC
MHRPRRAIRTLGNARRVAPRSRRRGNVGGPFDRFIERSRDAMMLAQDEARRSGRGFIGTEHLLLGIACGGQGVATGIPARSGVTIVGPGPHLHGGA